MWRRYELQIHHASIQCSNAHRELHRVLEVPIFRPVANLFWIKFAKHFVVNDFGDGKRTMRVICDEQIKARGTAEIRIINYVDREADPISKTIAKEDK